jgi:hypothetical protein
MLRLMLFNLYTLTVFCFVGPSSFAPLISDSNSPLCQIEIRVLGTAKRWPRRCLQRRWPCCRRWSQAAVGRGRRVVFCVCDIVGGGGGGVAGLRCVPPVCPGTQHGGSRSQRACACSLPHGALALVRSCVAVHLLPLCCCGVSQQSFEF